MRLILILFFAPTLSFGQIGTGQWRLHVPAGNAIDVATVDNRIFTAYENGLGDYDLSSNELSTWDAVNGLSDISLSCLGVSTSQNALFIGYENGNIDKLKGNTVTNIPAITLAQIQGSKKIYKIVEHGGSMYFATGFAIVKIDPIKDEVRDTYYPTNGNDAIIDVAFRNDSIFALTEDRMYSGDLNNPALADPAQWQEDARVPVLSANTYGELETFENELLISLSVDGYGLDTVYRIEQSGLTQAISESFSLEIYDLRVVNGRFAMSLFDGVVLYDTNLNQEEIINLYSFGTARPNGITYADSHHWIADGTYGLVEYISSGNNQRISIIGPPKNTFYSMDWKNGKLAIAGGGLSQVFNTFSSSGLYTFENEEWSLSDLGTVSQWTGQNIWDFVSCSIKTGAPNTIAVGTYSELPLSILNESSGSATVYTESNSLLENTSLGNGWCYLSSLEYDEAGNLWVLNGYANEPLKVLSNDGQWYSFDLGTTAKSKFTKNMEIDYNGNKWLAITGAGLYGYKDNGTISNPSDDEYVLINSGEITGALPSNEVNAIAVDFDNEIWIGTDNGFAVLYNSDGAFGAGPGDYNAQRIKLEFEGNVEYVLGATNVTDIEVDGGNRKWFGTANSGIILLSADGLEVIEQHTMENSPLISNNIIDLELDQTTGELFIITDKGLISYRTDATYEDPNYSDVNIFPNPARPDFDGPITIQGIRYNSDVRITDVAGNPIYQTTSNGGTATWDGKTLDGVEVSTGVYLIWTAANEGKGRFVGKVLIVND